MSRATAAVEVDPGDVAAEQHRSARLDDHFSELHRQDARAALDERAARFEIPALRHGEKWPRHVAGIVGVVADIARDREFRRLVVAKEPLKDFGGRRAPIVNKTTQFESGAQQLAERALLARLDQTRDAGMDLFHRPKKPREAIPALGESTAQRLMRGVEAHRQIEYVADRAAPHRKERIDRDPLDLVEKA